MPKISVGLGHAGFSYEDVVEFWLSPFNSSHGLVIRLTNQNKTSHRIAIIRYTNQNITSHGLAITLTIQNISSKMAIQVSTKIDQQFINGELSGAEVPTFPARSWLSKIHGGLWRIDEFTGVMKERNHVYSFRPHWVIT